MRCTLPPLAEQERLPFPLSGAFGRYDFAARVARYPLVHPSGYKGREQMSVWLSRIILRGDVEAAKSLEQNLFEEQGTWMSYRKPFGWERSTSSGS